MSAVIARQSVHLRRRSLLGWVLGLVSLTVLQVGMYPSVRDNDLYENLLEDYPEELLAFFGGVTNMGTPEGYLQLEMFSFMLPLLFIGAGIAVAAGTLAGEEEAGLLGVVLARPLSRRRLVAEKYLAVLHSIGVLTAALFVTLAVVGPMVRLDVALTHLAAACLAVGLLGLVFATITFSIGAATGHRALAIGLGAALAVGAYVVESLSQIVDALDPLAAPSPFRHTVNLHPLVEGIAPVPTLALLVTTAAVLAVGSVAFERRDLNG
jgi:ABC-2 type transport system permease protein